MPGMYMCMMSYNFNNLGPQKGTEEEEVICLLNCYKI